MSRGARLVRFCGGGGEREGIGLVGCCGRWGKRGLGRLWLRSELGTGGWWRREKVVVVVGRV